MNHNDINHPFLKFCVGCGSFLTIDLLTDWGRAAAALVSIAMLAEIVWKRLLRPALRLVMSHPRPRWLESTRHSRLDEHPHHHDQIDL